MLLNLVMVYSNLLELPPVLLKLMHKNEYKTREEAKSSIFRYIEEYCNRKKMHSAIDYRTLNKFELPL